MCICTDHVRLGHFDQFLSSDNHRVTFWIGSLHYSLKPLQQLVSRLGHILSVVADSSNKSMSCRFHDSKRLARIVTVASEADDHNQLLNCQRASNKNRHAAREAGFQALFLCLGTAQTCLDLVSSTGTQAPCTPCVQTL